MIESVFNNTAIQKADIKLTVPEKPVKLYPPYPLNPPDQKQVAKEYFKELGLIIDIYV